ncbi:MAG: hypothetical protein AB7W16_28125 [Candidatus Obscuribacterales bacterium]
MKNFDMAETNIECTPAEIFELLSRQGEGRYLRQIKRIESAIQKIPHLLAIDCSYNCVMREATFRIVSRRKEIIHTPLIAVDALHVGSSRLQLSAVSKFTLKLEGGDVKLSNIQGFYVIMQGVRAAVKCRIFALTLPASGEMPTLLCAVSPLAVPGYRAGVVSMKLAAAFLHDKQGRQARTTIQREDSRRCRNTCNRLASKGAGKQRQEQKVRLATLVNNLLKLLKLRTAVENA